MTDPPHSGLRIGSLELPLPAVQAALSGYSDLPMRRVARAHGAPYALHEVVLDRLLLEPGKLQRRILTVPADDHPVGGQLMGADPANFGPAARLLVDGGFDVVDLNFGCPVPKVLGRCRGGYLLSEPDTALRMIDAVMDAVGDEVPVSVKMRRGLDDSPQSEARFDRILDGAIARGVAAVTVHPRSVEQRYVGPSRWEFLRRVVDRVAGRLTVLGSGDLFAAGDVSAMLRDTGVDGVTVARGAIGNPWIFGQIADLLAGRVPRPPSLGEQRAAIELHWRESLAHLGAKRGPGRARTHTIKYASLHPDGVPVRDAAVAIRDPDGLTAFLDRHYPPDRAGECAADAAAAAAAAHALKDCGVAGSTKTPAGTAR